MRTSPAGLSFIAAEEGTVLHPYPDSRGFATIFVGHLIRQGPVRSSDWQAWAPLTRAHAIAVLLRDAHGLSEATIAHYVRVPLNQNEYDALASLIFNIGPGNFASSTVLRRLNAGDRKGAADAFLMWHVGGPGLMGRRVRERHVFLTPVKAPPKPKPTEDLSVLHAEERTVVDEYDHLVRRGARAQRRAQLRGQMEAMRKRIWVLSQPGAKGGDGKGWHHYNRLRRYRILEKRTR